MYGLTQCSCSETQKAVPKHPPASVTMDSITVSLPTSNKIEGSIRRRGVDAGDHRVTTESKGVAQELLAVDDET